MPEHIHDFQKLKDGDLRPSTIPAQLLERCECGFVRGKPNTKPSPYYLWLLGRSIETPQC